MGFWLILAYVGATILSYLLNRGAKSKVQQPGEIQSPEVAAGTPIPVAFGRVKLEPIIAEFAVKIFRWENQTADGPLTIIPGQKVLYGYRYVVTYLGLLCWGPILEWEDIIFDETKRLSDQEGQFVVSIEFDDPNFYGHADPPTMTVTPTPAVAYGEVGNGSEYAEIFLPLLFGGRGDLGGEGGIQRHFDNVPITETCLGRAPVGGSYHMFHGTDNTQTGSPNIAQLPIDDVRYFGTMPRDISCDPDPTTSGPGRIQYPHYGYVYLNEVEVGTSPVLKKQEHVIKVRLGGGASLLSSGDALAPGVIQQIICDQEWGLGASEAFLDTDSFSAVSEAMGDANGAEHFGISGVFREQRPAEECIEEILRTIDAALYRHPESGKLAIQLIRGGYTVGALPLLDASNVKELEWSRRDVADTINTVSVAFIDRDRLWNRNVVTVQDHANIHATGGVRAQLFEYPFISNETDALRVAARDLKSNTLPLGSGTIVATRDQWDSVPGDVLRLTWPRYGLSNVPVRIVSVNEGTLEDGLLEIEIVEDKYGLPEVPYTITTDPWDDPAASSFVPPTVVATKQDDGIEGIATLSIVNDASVTLVEFATQTGRDAMSAYSTATGGPQYTSQPVALSVVDLSFIYWRVTYTDAHGDSQVITGIVAFGSSPTATVGAPDPVTVDHVSGPTFVFARSTGQQVFIKP